MAELDLDNLAARLLNVGSVGGRLTTCVNDQKLQTLCFKAKQVFSTQSSLMEIQPPVIACGDIHGQYSDLLCIFDKNGFPPEVNYLFLGDYVDRGRQNIETICLMFCLKIKYPENFFMLRGNHECLAINRAYDFYEECNKYQFEPVTLPN